MGEKMRDEPFTGSIGNPLATMNFPVRIARIVLLLLLGSLLVVCGIVAAYMLQAMPPDTPGRGITMGTMAVLAGVIILGMLGGQFMLRNKPTQLAVHEQALVVHYANRRDIIPWPHVQRLDQELMANRVPVNVIELSDGNTVVFGVNSKSKALARLIVTKARLSWIEEPFRAART